MEHPCSSPTFRPLPCGLSWQTHSVQRCELPAPERLQPAGQLPWALLEKDGKGHRAAARGRPGRGGGAVARTSMPTRVN